MLHFISTYFIIMSESALVFILCLIIKQQTHEEDKDEN